MRNLYCKKGELYYLRLPSGYLRVVYQGMKDHKRYFNLVNGKMQYILSKDEVNRLVARVPYQAAAQKRLKNFKKFKNKGERR